MGGESTGSRGGRSRQSVGGVLGSYRNRLGEFWLALVCDDRGRPSTSRLALTTMLLVATALFVAYNCVALYRWYKMGEKPEIVEFWWAYIGLMTVVVGDKALGRSIASRGRSNDAAAG